MRTVEGMIIVNTWISTEVRGCIYTLLTLHLNWIIGYCIVEEWPGGPTCARLSCWENLRVVARDPGRPRAVPDGIFFIMPDLISVMTL